MANSSTSLGTKDAFVLRRFTDAGERKTFPAGAVILGMTEGRFANLGGRVREATPAEVAAALEGSAPAPVDATPSHPRGLVPPPPPPAPPKRVRKPSKKAAAAKATKAGAKPAGKAKAPARKPAAARKPKSN